MSPTRRLNLAEVEPVPVDAAACCDLLRQSANHLASARAVAAIDPEGAFALGYDGCRKVALATISLSAPARAAMLTTRPPSTPPLPSRPSTSTIMTRCAERSTTPPT